MNGFLLVDFSTFYPSPNNTVVGWGWSKFAEGGGLCKTSLLQKDSGGK